MKNYPELATGYFARISNYKEKGYFPVSIARFTPEWCSELPVLLEVAPSEQILYDWKNNKIDEAEYYAEYVKIVLCGLHIGDFLDKVFKLSNNKPVVMLCYEKSNEFCHRHLLARHITGITNIPVKELSGIKGLLDPCHI